MVTNINSDSRDMPANVTYGNTQLGTLPGLEHLLSGTPVHQLLDDPGSLALGVYGDDPDAHDEPLEPDSVPLGKATLGSEVYRLVAPDMLETKCNQSAGFVPEFAS